MCPEVERTSAVAGMNEVEDLVGAIRTGPATPAVSRRRRAYAGTGHCGRGFDFSNPTRRVESADFAEHWLAASARCANSVRNATLRLWRGIRSRKARSSRAGKPAMKVTASLDRRLPGALANRYPAAMAS